MRKNHPTNQKHIKVFIADDHSFIREEIATIIGKVDGFKVVGQADGGDQAIEEIKKMNPDIAILDIFMPGKTGFDVTRVLKKENSKVKVVFLTMHSDEELTKEAMDLGSKAYVLKENVSEQLIDVLQKVSQGETFFEG